MYKSHKGPVAELHIVDQYMMEVHFKYLPQCLNIKKRKGKSNFLWISLVTSDLARRPLDSLRVCVCVCVSERGVFSTSSSVAGLWVVVTSSWHSSHYQLAARLQVMWPSYVGGVQAAAALTGEQEDPPTAAPSLPSSLAVT